ncbi:glycosyltransferase 87 family protein [Streptomyces sp. NPDC002324]
MCPHQPAHRAHRLPARRRRLVPRRPRRLPNPDSRHKPIQAGGAVLAFGTTVALLVVLRRRGDPRRAPAAAALWAWCPAVPFEAANNAHIDTFGVPLAVLALGTATAGTCRGALFGAAIAVELLPVLALPGALSGQRGPARVVRVVTATAASVVLAYVPYVIVSGTGVLAICPATCTKRATNRATATCDAVGIRPVLPSVPPPSRSVSNSRVPSWRRSTGQ